MPNLDQMPARVEEVEVLTLPARAAARRIDRPGGLVARTAHVSDRVEIIAIFDFRVDDSAEDLVEFVARHRERKMLAALGAPRRKLQGEIRRHADNRKRLAIPFMLEAQDADVKLDALLSIVHGENQMVKLYGHCTPLTRDYSLRELVSDKRLPSGSLNQHTLPNPSGVVQIPASSCCSSGTCSNLTPFFASFSTVASMSETFQPSAVKGTGVNFSRGFSM